MLAVQNLVDKAENDIKLKTEAVLNSTLNEQYTTLPAIRDSKRRTQQRRAHSAGSAGGGGGARSITVMDQMTGRRQMDMIMRPTGQSARQFLMDRFGVTAPPPLKAKEAAKVRGRLIKRKNSEANVLPATVRNDPQVPSSSTPLPLLHNTLVPAPPRSASLCCLCGTLPLWRLRVVWTFARRGQAF